MKFIIFKNGIILRKKLITKVEPNGHKGSYVYYLDNKSNVKYYIVEDSPEEIYKKLMEKDNANND